MEPTEVKNKQCKKRGMNTQKALVDVKETTTKKPGKHSAASKQSESTPESLWQFEKAGIGGLPEDVKIQLRTAFLHQTLPVDLKEHFNFQSPSGIVLHGPPGCGKTLIARKIGLMLNAHDPKIVRGPEILNKFVGQSEKNLRKLFKEAEEEQNKKGVKSKLHLIIFDEIDSLFRHRSTGSSGNSVQDRVVNQFLTCLSGVIMLHNVLVIGTTNRLDLLDPAVLRPGRLGIQIEIGLPDKKGREDILSIHSVQKIEKHLFAEDVNISALAEMTQGFTGAELEFLVNDATNIAILNCIKDTSTDERFTEKLWTWKITQKDFNESLKNRKSVFKTDKNKLACCKKYGVISWGEEITEILAIGQKWVKMMNNNTTSLLSILVEGPPGSGKTALAAELADYSQCEFIQICSLTQMIGLSELSMCVMIEKIFEKAYRSQFSCIIIDDIEQLVHYNPSTQKSSIQITSCLLAMMKKEPPKGNKLLIIVTADSLSAIKWLQMQSCFRVTLALPNIATGDQLVCVFKEMDKFTGEELSHLKEQLTGVSLNIGIKSTMELHNWPLEDNRVEEILKFLQM